MYEKMNLKEAYNKCEHGSNLLNPKSDQEVKFFQSLFQNEDFWVSTDHIESLNLKNVVCKVDVIGELKHMF